MIPVFFKIFLLLFVKQGLAVLPAPGDTNYFSYAVVVQPMTLAIRSDASILDEMINICWLMDIQCSIKKAGSSDAEGNMDALIEFKNLSAKNRTRLMQQLGGFQQRTRLEWRTE